MKKPWKTIVLGVLALLLLIQFVPVRRDNPPVTSDVNAPETVKRILMAACYDCHSHQTRWPVYSYAAPVSWLIASDVRAGRAHLNFSRWGEYPESAQKFLRTRIYKEVADGDMPPMTYLLLHPAARVTPSALKVFKEWTRPALDADHQPNQSAREP